MRHIILSRKFLTEENFKQIVSNHSLTFILNIPWSFIKIILKNHTHFYVSKCESLTGKYVLPEKDLLEEAAVLKRFKYSPLSKELKAQTAVAKSQYKFF